MIKKAIVKNCHCNNKALFYTDISKGTYVYKCNTSDKIVKGKSLLNFVPNPIRPCDYYEEVPYCSEFSHSLPFEKEPIKKIKKNQWENLRKKIDYFLEKKYYITFQEIERECTLLNIPLYNHLQESMYNFCLRVQKICLSQQTKIL